MNKNQAIVQSVINTAKDVLACVGKGDLLGAESQVIVGRIKVMAIAAHVENQVGEKIVSG